MVKGIHKKYLKDKYSRPDIKGVSRIGIDELVKSEQAHPLGDGKNPFTGGQK
jgi:hypothetical protein